ncbi:hypothetical protein SAMN05421827_1342 [Pedobacter terrae]|uniref:Uncharacterized protein n=1 Tax=Pedobacter terrae TaxID=405671 RepID=A0A1G8E5B6_9SPHI|nr:hypothetical protein SAMN05421827_1342 [Pedobacter terrae]
MGILKRVLRLASLSTSWFPHARDPIASYRMTTKLLDSVNGNLSKDLKEDLYR